MHPTSFRVNSEPAERLTHCSLKFMLWGMGDLLRFKSLKNRGLAVLIFALVGLVAGIFYTREFPVSYEASQTVFVKRQTSGPSTQFYAYDGYYSAQAAERFADSLVGLLKSPEVLRLLLIRDETLTTSSKSSVAKMVSGVRVRRLSPQLISFSFRGPGLENSQTVVQDIAQGLSQLSLDLSRGGDEGLALHFIDSRPQVITRFQNVYINSLLGALIGIFGFLIVLLFWNYRHTFKYD